MNDAPPPPADRAYFALPGCGLAAYVLVLGVFFVLGMFGLTMWTLTVFDASSGASPNNLAYGGTVSGYQLAPMRAAALLGPEEIPDVFHAETLDGSTACALSRGVLLRLGPEGTGRLPLAEIRSVTGDALAVTATGTTTVVCRFEEGEGGDRFHRMLEHR